MSYAFSTGRELIALCEKENLTIAEVMIRREAETSEKTRDELVNEMFENLLTMQKSIRFGLEENQQTVTGLAGGNAEKLMAYAEKANMGRDMAQICAAALAVAEVNASMGRIVAAPTAVVEIINILAFFARSDPARKEIAPLNGVVEYMLHDTKILYASRTRHMRSRARAGVQQVTDHNVPFVNI